MKCTCGVLLLLLCAMKAQAMDRAELVIINDTTMERDTKDVLQLLIRRVCALEAKNAELQEKILFLIEHSSEAKLALLDLEKKAQLEAEQAERQAAEISKQNHIIGAVLENGKFLQMKGGLILLVSETSRSHVRRWKTGATIEVIGKVVGEWFNIRNRNLEKVQSNLSAVGFNANEDQATVMFYKGK
jgi:hypothetical protein